MCNFSIISMLQDLKKKNFKHSDYTTATPNTIYMYIRLPIENVIYCVTYMNIKQIPIYFIRYTTATKHFITQSVGQQNVFYIRYDGLLFIHPFIYISTYFISFHTCSVLIKYFLLLF